MNSPPGRPVHLRDLPVAPADVARTDALVRVPLESLPRPVDFAALFGNTRNVELEVGVGKGRFVLLAATAKPDVNFFGVEYAHRYFIQAVERVAKRALDNVRLCEANVVTLLATHLAHASLSAVHVYFPDPWPKKRHHKRRFFQTDVIDLVARALRPGGLLRAATDHPDYAATIREVMNAHAAFIDAGTDATLWELPGMGDYTTLGVTNFEIKYRREGRPIHRFAWRRR